MSRDRSLVRPRTIRREDARPGRRRRGEPARAPQATALRELTGPMTMRELADRMTCEPSNATFVVDKLEAQGLIERHAHPTDRRARQLVLTPQGAAVRERLLDLLVQESPLAGLSQQEQRTLHELLQRALARP